VTKPPPTCHLSVGTSGYSYEEWLNDFYPANTPAQQMLPYYARMFSLTELNYTWYAMPRAEAIERMLKHVNPDFKFAAKLTRTMTHEIDPKQWRNQVNRYREGIAPLIMSRQLAAILIQFPQSFNRSDNNRRYLAACWISSMTFPLSLNFAVRPGLWTRYLMDWQSAKSPLSPWMSLICPDCFRLLMLSQPGIFLCPVPWPQCPRMAFREHADPVQL
jgi:uncharacterized protein YecE (DUF72 family)